MDLELVESHPRWVLEAFRQGEFDDLEILGQADEKAFFELGFREQLLAGLAEAMPTARQKEEVPRWLVLAANLSLKLPGEHAFLAWERVVRCGGVLSALDPAIASKHLDREHREVIVPCVGFNEKNQYDRPTPCDQDMLRKYVRDVRAQPWQDWFNGAVQEVFQQDGFFDPEGVFLGDGSYLFVPDNPAYEGSVVLWFDEHNHPVKLRGVEPGRAEEGAPGTVRQAGESAPSTGAGLCLCGHCGGAGKRPRTADPLPVGERGRAARDLRRRTPRGLGPAHHRGLCRSATTAPRLPPAHRDQGAPPPAQVLPRPELPVPSPPESPTTSAPVKPHRPRPPAAAISRIPSPTV